MVHTKCYKVKKLKSHYNKMTKIDVSVNIYDHLQERVVTLCLKDTVKLPWI